MNATSSSLFLLHDTNNNVDEDLVEQQQQQVVVEEESTVTAAAALVVQRSTLEPTATTAAAVATTTTSSSSSSRIKQRWTSDELEALTQAIQQYDGEDNKQYESIAKLIPTRTIHQIRQRIMYNTNKIVAAATTTTKKRRSTNNNNSNSNSNNSIKKKTKSNNEEQDKNATTNDGEEEEDYNTNNSTKKNNSSSANPTTTTAAAAVSWNFFNPLIVVPSSTRTIVQQLHNHVQTLIATSTATLSSPVTAPPTTTTTTTTMLTSSTNVTTTTTTNSTTLTPTQPTPPFPTGTSGRRNENDIVHPVDSSNTTITSNVVAASSLLLLTKQQTTRKKNKRRKKEQVSVPQDVWLSSSTTLPDTTTNDIKSVINTDNNKTTQQQEQQLLSPGKGIDISAKNSSRVSSSIVRKSSSKQKRTTIMNKKYNDEALDEDDDSDFIPHNLKKGGKRKRDVSLSSTKTKNINHVCESTVSDAVNMVQVDDNPMVNEDTSNEVHTHSVQRSFQLSPNRVSNNNNNNSNGKVSLGTNNKQKRVKVNTLSPTTTTTSKKRKVVQDNHLKESLTNTIPDTSPLSPTGAFDGFGVTSDYTSNATTGDQATSSLDENMESLTTTSTKILASDSNPDNTRATNSTSLSAGHVGELSLLPKSAIEGSSSNIPINTAATMYSIPMPLILPPPWNESVNSWMKESEQPDCVNLKSLAMQISEIASFGVDMTDVIAIPVVQGTTTKVPQCPIENVDSNPSEATTDVEDPGLLDPQRPELQLQVEPQKLDLLEPAMRQPHHRLRCHRCNGCRRPPCGLCYVCIVRDLVAPSKVKDLAIAAGRQQNRKFVSKARGLYCCCFRICRRSFSPALKSKYEQTAKESVELNRDIMTGESPLDRLYRQTYIDHPFPDGGTFGPKRVRTKQSGGHSAGGRNGGKRCMNCVSCLRFSCGLCLVCYHQKLTTADRTSGRLVEEKYFRQVCCFRPCPFSCTEPTLKKYSNLALKSIEFTRDPVTMISPLEPIFKETFGSNALEVPSSDNQTKSKKNKVSITFIASVVSPPLASDVSSSIDGQITNAAAVESKVQVAEMEERHDYGTLVEEIVFGDHYHQSHPVDVEATLVDGAHGYSCLSDEGGQFASLSHIHDSCTKRYMALLHGKNCPSSSTRKSQKIASTKEKNVGTMIDEVFVVHDCDIQELVLLVDEQNEDSALDANKHDTLSVATIGAAGSENRPTTNDDQESDAERFTPTKSPPSLMELTSLGHQKRCGCCSACVANSCGMCLFCQPLQLMNIAHQAPSSQSPHQKAVATGICCFRPCLHSSMSTKKRYWKEARKSLRATCDEATGASPLEDLFQEVFHGLGFEDLASPRELSGTAQSLVCWDTSNQTCIVREPQLAPNTSALSKVTSVSSFRLRNQIQHSHFMNLPDCRSRDGDVLQTETIQVDDDIGDERFDGMSSDTESDYIDEHSDKDIVDDNSSSDMIFNPKRLKAEIKQHPQEIARLGSPIRDKAPKPAQQPRQGSLRRKDHTPLQRRLYPTTLTTTRASIASGISKSPQQVNAMQQEVVLAPFCFDIVVVREAERYQA